MSAGNDAITEETAGEIPVKVRKREELQRMLSPWTISISSSPASEKVAKKEIPMYSTLVDYSLDAAGRKKKQKTAQCEKQSPNCTVEDKLFRRCDECRGKFRGARSGGS